MPWNDNANPGPWGSPGGGDDRRDPPRGPFGGGPRRPGGPGGPDFNAGFEQLTNRLRDLMGGSGGRPRGQLLAIVGGGLALAWLASGFYVVQPGEQAIVTTFGAYSRTGSPGPNYHLPAPIEHVEKVAVTKLLACALVTTRPAWMQLGSPVMVTANTCDQLLPLADT